MEASHCVFYNLGALLEKRIFIISRTFLRQDRFDHRPYLLEALVHDDRVLLKFCGLVCYVKDKNDLSEQ